MEVRERVVVVTGGASGIGAALCRRFAAEGARGVVVADRDEAGASAVADAIGGVAVGCDVADEAQVRALVTRVEGRFGAIDLFCANAGVALGGGLDPMTAGPFAPDEAWTTSWAVNVMAHVYAARAVLPAMLERGEGTLLTTASAAGLLTDLGSQAYSVTKHAAVAFAEWLAIAYGERGIRISCLCPMGVRTPMVEGAAAAGIGAHLLPGALEPEAVADAVIEGLREERFLILPHPQVADFFQRRAGDPDRWLRGMRRLRTALYGA
ncbi:SDR family oxidoreductase [Myxococcota bacterium]|nr:SDR family oxidoreductase [Myxococcota bacterium]MCZ7619162.1 SDR family oxidoreductase [Myxococcota bacterium]